MKRLFCIYAGLLVCILVSAPIEAQTLLVHGGQLRKGFAVLMIDDSPTENEGDGSNMVTKLIVVLDENGYPAELMMVTCHLISDQLPITDIYSSMCMSGQHTITQDMLRSMVARGYLPRNHTDRHVPMQKEDDDGVLEVTNAQKLLDPFQPDGLALLRCPGLSCGSKEVALYHADPYLAKVIVFDADIGTSFTLPDGTVVLGDGNCPAHGLTAAGCGQLFVDAIRRATHGVILLMHLRSETLTGRDGNEFMLNTILYVISNFPEITWVPGDAVPGVLGNIHISPPVQVSTEFGSDDEQRLPVAGNITGQGRSGICKARDNTVWCKTPSFRKIHEPVRKREENKSIGFEKATPWTIINGPEWESKFNSTFWLVDLNNDGLDDVVFPEQDPNNPKNIRLMVGYSNNANGFSSAVEILTASLDVRGIRFADVDGDGWPDIVAWTTNGVLVYLNTGGDSSSRSFIPHFSGPFVVSLDFPASEGWGSETYMSSFRVRDIDGDGRADLVFNGAGVTKVALSAKPDLNGKWSGFGRASIWTSRFSDQQSGWVPSAYRCFSIVKINDPATPGKFLTGIAQGMPTGIVFQEANPVLSRFTLYRYLDNEHFTNVLDSWHPERFTSGLLFADFDGSGNESPLLVRSDGLYLGLIVNK
jgi:hypothetical protein